jgi:hypothetical protein
MWTFNDNAKFITTQNKIKKENISMKKLATIALAVFIAVSALGISVFAATKDTQKVFYDISNPYANVNWATTGQYKAAHHTHSTYSDGSNMRGDVLKDKYAKNFDIVAMTDHDVLTNSWDTNPNPATGNWNNIGQGNLATEEMTAINAGTYGMNNPSPGTYNGNRTNNNGMIGMGGSNEITASNETFDGGGSNFSGHHINAFFADYSTNSVASGQRTMVNILAKVQELGGITHINHAGRYTGGQNNADRSSNPDIVGKYVSLFMAYNSCVGVEIINKWDGESVNDRILWDNILMQTMPQDRPVWGFSNDDSHSLSANGHAWNVMIMPALTEAETKISMKTGAFYGVSRIDRKHNINSIGTPGAPAQTTTTESMYSGGTNNDMALGFLAQGHTPSISDIIVNGNTITITGADYDFINWIADGVVVAAGNSIDVSKYSGINSYVRAELIGKTGVAYSQPFGVKEVTTDDDRNCKDFEGCNAIGYGGYLVLAIFGFLLWRKK